MQIVPVQVGSTMTSSYLAFKNKENATIIDPGADANKLLKKIEEKNLTIKQIIITHSHFDHIGAVKEIYDQFKSNIYIHHEEKNWLSKPDKNLSTFVGQDIAYDLPVKTLSEEDEIYIASHKFIVFHTPGHSPGSICLYNSDNKILFSGDTIFERGIGRTDLPGGDGQTLKTSIENKVLTLPDDTIVYPGHGQKTTLAEFKNTFWNNMF